MKKRISIIPGLTHKPTDTCYRWLIAFLKRAGFDVQLIHIDWQRRVMSDYVEQFLQQYRKNMAEENYVLGFSFGAMIAFISAKRASPKRLFLCSLSPYFKEDLNGISNSVQRYMGKQRMADFKKYSAAKIAQEIHVPTIIFCGESEGSRYPTLLKRCQAAARTIPGASLVIPSGAPHEIDYPTYIDAIKKAFTT